MSQATRFYVKFHNGTTPPPYNFAYTVDAKLLAGQELQVAFSLEYRYREELSEEEILEEGFTLDDDYSWEGVLPAAWSIAIANLAGRSSWPKDQDRARAEEPYLYLEITDQEGQLQKGVPANKATWEYFLQELMQAVFEQSGKERPLEVTYRENHAQTPFMVHLSCSFAERRFEAEVMRPREQPRIISLPWNSLQKTLQLLYLPEYDGEKGKPKPPKKPGQFIDLGEGLWYDLKKDTHNPNPERPASQQIIQLFRDWAKAQ